MHDVRRCVILAYVMGTLVLQITWAAGTRLVFEAESTQARLHLGYSVVTPDANTPAASGNALLCSQAVDDTMHNPGRPPFRRLTFRFRIPRQDTYYFWARVYWGFICCDEDDVCFVCVNNREYPFSDFTANALHWVPFKDFRRPIAMELSPGTVDISFRGGAHTYIDQVLLTTDPKMHPRGSYRPTPGALVSDQRKQPHVSRRRPIRLVAEAEDGGITGETVFCFPQLHDLVGTASSKSVVSLFTDTERMVYRNSPQSNMLSYTVRIPKTGSYHVWVRGSRDPASTTPILLSAGKEAHAIDISLQLTDTLSWVSPLFGTGQPTPIGLQLEKGQLLTVYLDTKAAGVRVDEFLLTNNLHFRPEGCYAPTPDALVAMESVTR